MNFKPRSRNRPTLLAAQQLLLASMACFGWPSALPRRPRTRPNQPPQRKRRNQRRRQGRLSPRRATPVGPALLSLPRPDKAKGGLRLNKQKSALAELDSGEHAIVPGKPDESALLERIASTDEGVRMPPEGKPLTPEQVRLLTDWIAAGADVAKLLGLRAGQRRPDPRRCRTQRLGAQPDRQLHSQQADGARF